MEARILEPLALKDAEAAAFARGVSAEALMEQAGEGVARVIAREFPEPGRCIVFFGKGHNGGDALVAARHLARRGWHIELRPVFSQQSLAALTSAQLERLQTQLAAPRPLAPGRALVVLDGILGLGASGAPREPAASAIREIARLRAERGAWVVAVDVPSGWDASTGVPADPCVQADLTAVIACAKTGLLTDSAINATGRLAWIPLPELHEDIRARAHDSWQLATAETLRLPPLPFDRHKGDAGRVLIVAGSPGYTGAARLCATGALHAGAGLITLLAHPACAPALEAACPPEIMVRATPNLTEALERRADALALGPGLGRERDIEALRLIREFPGPAVVDADALNALCALPGLLKKTAGPRVLTPHPGEMERLYPCRGRTRRQWAADFARESGAVVLLKGARTVIAAAHGGGFINTTGHPGMATGGMGDLLTGVIAALLGAGLEPLRAAATGAWVCGRAAELAARGTSAEALTPSITAACLGEAFSELRADPES